MGDSEKVAKNAVDEHKMSGSLRLSSPSARLNAAQMHLKLSILLSFNDEGQNNPRARNVSSSGTISTRPRGDPPLEPKKAAFKDFIINKFVCKVTCCF